MMQAMIFAAGLGTRLKPLTDHCPKALVEVGGKTLLERVITKLKDAGTDRIIINVHHFAEQVTDFLRNNNNFGTEIIISDESGKLLDTGGGIKKAIPLFRPDCPILIHNVDILSNVDLKDFYLSHLENDATLLVSERKTKRYLLLDDCMNLAGWTNIETGEVRSPYPDLQAEECRRLAFSGIHIFSPRLFPMTEGFPDKFGIMDFYLKVCDKVKIKAYEKAGLKLLDVGKPGNLAQAESFLKDIM